MLLWWAIIIGGIHLIAYYQFDLNIVHVNSFLLPKFHFKESFSFLSFCDLKISLRFLEHFEQFF